MSQSAPPPERPPPAPRAAAAPDLLNAKSTASRRAAHRPVAAAPQAALACACYVACSVALTMANKKVFSMHAFDFPWMILATQSLAVAAILLVYLLVARRPALSLRLFKQMLVPCVLFTFYIFTNSRALRDVSLPILSVLKSLAPMGIAVAEKIVFADRITAGTATAMVLIVVGNAVTVLNDMDYSRNGYAWALANVAINIAYVLSLRVCLTDTFTPVQKAVHSNLVAFTIMGPLAFASGEVVPFLAQLPQTPLLFRAVFAASCLLCAGIGAAIFWVVQTTSGSTLSFVGACNKFLVVILGGILFKTNITPVGWVSVFFGVMAGVVFAVAKTSGKKMAPAEGEEGETARVDLASSDSDDEDDERREETHLR